MLDNYHHKEYEPADPFYNLSSYFLKNPLVLLTWPLGRLIGKAMIRAQQFDENLPYIISEHGFKSNYFIQKNQQVTLSDADRRIVLFFNGNEMNLKPGKISSKIMEFYNSDIASFTHPKNASNVYANTDCAITMVEMLMAKGYKPENIIFFGYSLGGAIAAKTLLHFKNKNIEFGEYINHRSFASVSQVVSHMYLSFLEYDNSGLEGKSHDLKQSKLLKLFTFIVRAVLWLTAWDMHTLNDIRNGLPVKRITVGTSIDDHHIGNQSTLWENMPENLKSNVNHRYLAQRHTINLTDFEQGYSPSHINYRDRISDTDLKQVVIHRM